MAISARSSVFLVPASTPLPTARLLAVPGVAFTAGSASARRMVVLAGGEPATRRHGVVCFLASGTPPSGDEEAKIEAVAFKAAMEAFDDSFRPLVLVGNGKVLKEVEYSVDGCRQLLDMAMETVPITLEQLQELVRAGEAFVTLAGECREGYVRAVTLVEAIDGVKGMCTVISSRIDFLPMETTALDHTVPASIDDLDEKEKYLADLSKELYSLYQHLRWQLYRHLGVFYW